MRWRDWLGVGERRWKKSGRGAATSEDLCEWLQLLIVPAILIAVTYALGLERRRESDNKTENRIKKTKKRKHQHIPNDKSGRTGALPRIEQLPKEHTKTRRSRPISTR